jgi:uncharacterized protein YecT (DUF1311 family)
MKNMNLVLAVVIVSAIAAPSAVLAAFPEPSTYAAFVPSAVQTSVMTDELAATCLRGAERDPNNLTLQVVCHDAHTARLDNRIRVSIRNQMPRARSAAVRRFTANQSAWVSARTNVCKTKWSAELNPSSNSFGLAVSKCVADETYRRAVWIESVVR